MVEIKDVKRDLHEVKKEVRDANYKITSLEVAVKGLSGSVQKLESVTNDTASKLSDLEHSSSAKLDKICNLLSDQGHRIDALNQDVVTIKRDMAGLNLKVSNGFENIHKSLDELKSIIMASHKYFGSDKKLFEEELVKKIP